jgi:hypothetical protein
VELGIDSISLNPDVILPTTQRILETERVASTLRLLGRDGEVHEVPELERELAWPGD